MRTAVDVSDESNAGGRSLLSRRFTRLTSSAWLATQRASGILVRCAIAANVLACSSYLPFLLLAPVAHIFRLFTGRRLFETVFFVYAADRRYADAYTLRLHQRWAPFGVAIAGMLSQGGRLGLVLGVCAVEAALTDRTHRERLRRLIGRLRRVRRLVGADHVTYAGILPGVLSRRGLGEGREEEARLRVAEVIRDALEHVERRTGSPPSTVWVLGGGGHVGSALVDLLESGEARRVVTVERDSDPAVVQAMAEGDVIIDVSRPGVIERYIPHLPPGAVLLNEVYPEPRPKTIERLRRRGCRAFHIVGVVGRIVPPLPLGYRGAVPCCAIHGEVQAREAIVRELGIDGEGREP